MMQTNATKIVPNALFFDELMRFIQQGKEVQFLLKGSSMMPFLREGDQIIVQALHPLSATRVGYIVLAKVGATYVLHRIVRIQGNYVYLAGDANLVHVEKIETHQIMAVVKQVLRGNKPVPLYTWRARTQARLWYALRPIRRAIAKIGKI